MSDQAAVTTFSEAEAEAIIALTDFAYRFGDVERGTYLPDGKTNEDDATHTVVLSLQGLAIASRFFPQLDSGLVLKFALVHDLVETYAGDTSTLQIDEVGRQAKARREAAALQRIEAEFGNSFPEMVELIHAYERLDTPEARFVKMLDKLMPTLSHILNQGTTLHLAGIDLETYRKGNAKRTREYLATVYGQDNPELMALREALRPFLEEAVFGVPRPDQQNGDPS